MHLAPLAISLRQIQYLVAVAERRSFQAAARDCHVSQPALSAAVAQAEHALGVRIFDRDRHGVRLTLAGESFVAAGLDVLTRAQQLVSGATRFGDPLSGRLRVGLIPTVGPYLLPIVAPALRAQFPRLGLVWSEDKTALLLAQMDRGEIDAAVVALDDEVAKRPHAVLGLDPFVLAVPRTHALATESANGALTIDRLAGESLLLLDEGHCLRGHVLAVCAQTRTSDAGYRGTSLSTLVQMVAGGFGVTLLPALTLDVENRGGILVCSPFAAGGPARTLLLVWRGDVALAATASAVAEVITAAWERAKTEPALNA